MYIADLHIHSKYSRATSRDCDIQHLDLFARRKGIDLLGTGDFTHPAWREELSERLTPAEEGLYVLKDEYILSDDTNRWTNRPRFVITGEISSIYKKNGKVRKVHNVIILPSLEDAETLSHKLEAIGNIHSDGRPILGLSSRDLLELTLESCPNAMFVPAHIWTPHFSMFGAFSGFDTVSECFEDMTPYIHAVETGLSSDPPMNWRIPMLDSYTLISNSDAHSPAKLGREANILNTELSYPALKAAIEGANPDGFYGTIEFFPEEGKYHYDGHRSCELCLRPSETILYGGRCPKCGKKLTIGVEHRVEELAARPEGFILPGARPFESLVPLPEVIASSTGYTPASKRVAAQYEAMLRELGSEFSILRNVPLEEIGAVAGSCIQEGIRRLRHGQVTRIPGYDGKYGVVQLLSPDEIGHLSGQTSLLGFSAPKPPQKQKPVVSASIPKERKEPEKMTMEFSSEKMRLFDSLNDKQREAVCAREKTVAVIAGPGTGKTKTLISRIAYLIEERDVKPSHITAVTFTNKAADEMKERLQTDLSSKRAANAVHVGTFHSLCLQFLEEVRGPVVLLEEYEAAVLAKRIIEEQGLSISPAHFLQEVSRYKGGLSARDDKFGEIEGALERYCALQYEKKVLDFDDLLLETLRLWEAGEVPQAWKTRFSHLLVDEFQDSSPIQYRLIRVFCRGDSQLFVIGDPDQSIYGFRGASADIFSRLQKDEPDCRVIRLTQNYRSTPRILGCALPVISCNPGEPRELAANRPDGPAVRIVTAQSSLSEAIFTAKEIAKMTGGIDMLSAQDLTVQEAVDKPREFSEIAVLYRTHRQADLLEKCLRQEGLPCVVAGRDDFLGAPTVRGALAFFRFLLQPRDSVFLALCLKNVWECPADLCESVERFWGDSLSLPFSERLDALQREFESTGKLLGFFDAVRSTLPKLSQKPRKLLDTWVKEHSLARDDAFSRLRSTAVFHRTMEGFLRSLALGEESDIVRGSTKSYAAGAVTLMTLHGAKGLEFPVVFLCGVNEGTLPYKSGRRKADEEEERRLFFVGMTRAKEELLLLTSGHPSPFLADIPKELSRAESAARPKEDTPPLQMSLF